MNEELKDRLKKYGKEYTQPIMGPVTNLVGQTMLDAVAALEELEKLWPVYNVNYTAREEQVSGVPTNTSPYYFYGVHEDEKKS